MFTKLKWWLFNYQYCTKCHKMTRHTKNFIDIACCRCKLSKCDRTFKSIIYKYKNNQTIIAKDKATRNFLEYLVTNYQQSKGLLLEKETNTLLFDVDDKEIYKKYLDHLFNKAMMPDKMFANNFLVLFIIAFISTIIIICLLEIIKS